MSGNYPDCAISHRFRATDDLQVQVAHSFIQPEEIIMSKKFAASLAIFIAGVPGEYLEVVVTRRSARADGSTP